MNLLLAMVIMHAHIKAKCAAVYLSYCCMISCLLAWGNDIEMLASVHKEAKRVSQGVDSGGSKMTPMGFEPTPMKTTALTLRLRPLGHSVIPAKVVTH